MARRRTPRGSVRVVFLSLTTLAIAVTVSNTFYLNPFKYVMMDQAFWAILLAIFLPFTFLFFAAGESAPTDHVPWYDFILALLSAVGPIYVIISAEKIITEGWVILPPRTAVIVGLLTWLLLLEAVRRVAGLPLFIVVALFSIYPLFAHHMPSLLAGKAYTINRIVAFHFLSASSIFGLPIQVFARLIVGFMFFGVALQVTGGGKFFLDLAQGLLGHVRGGPAKVCILASSFFATMSGVAVSNVITTGSVTIPTMKRLGYPPYFAGAVEACASTGGLLMPPVMGITAFIMADFLRIPYYEVCLAAALPILLFYLGLFMQLDFYAAKTGMQGLPKAELPPLIKTLKQGWFYLGTVGVLIYFLFFYRVESWAPFFGIIFLFLCALSRKETRPGLRTLVELMDMTGRALVELTPLIAAVGMLIGALSLTGVAHSFASELSELAGENLALLLGFGAIGSLVLGMGMPISTCYIFLALMIGPALINFGLDPIATHLFFLYWGMLSFITPPVCLAVYAACGIAGSTVMQTGLQAVRLGLVGFIIPFFFVINPALVAQGSLLDILHSFLSCIAGVVLLSAGLEGYLLRLGAVGPVTRILLFVSGLLLMFPGWKSDLSGIGLLLITFLNFSHKHHSSQQDL
ncbi:TRAP transporter permease [Thermodesulfobacteriota bacterium]